MNLPICLQWVFLHHNKAEKHTHTFTHIAPSTKTQTTDPPASIPFAAHC